MREFFERFGKNLFIEVMKTQVCNTKRFCYIAPIVLNDIGKFNVVYEGFVIFENHDAYSLILNSLFKMCTSREKMKYTLYFQMNL